MADALPRIGAVHLGGVVERFVDVLDTGQRDDDVEAQLPPCGRDDHGHQRPGLVRQPVGRVLHAVEDADLDHPVVQVAHDGVVEPPEQHTGDGATDDDGYKDQRAVEPTETAQRIGQQNCQQHGQRDSHRHGAQHKPEGHTYALPILGIGEQSAVVLEAHKAHAVAEGRHAVQAQPERLHYRPIDEEREADQRGGEIEQALDQRAHTRTPARLRRRLGKRLFGGYCRLTHRKTSPFKSRM